MDNTWGDPYIYFEHACSFLYSQPIKLQQNNKCMNLYIIFNLIYNFLWTLFIYNCMVQESVLLKIYDVNNETILLL